jgi:RNA polymerase sigma factor (TIGR02999 family)
MARAQPVPAGAAEAKVEGLLARLVEGERDAFDELFPMVYRELHELARAHRERWNGNDTLNTTSLVHEAYLKLAEQENPSWQSRSHFLAVASRAMRQILIDYARRQGRIKRGGGYGRVSFEEVRDALRVSAGLTDHRLQALVALDASLERLQAVNARQARIIECRFFGGMTIKGTAEALGVSPATVKRGWSVALAWLYRDLKRSGAFEARAAARTSETDLDHEG